MAGEYHHIFCKAAVHVKNQTLVVKLQDGCSAPVGMSCCDWR